MFGMVIEIGPKFYMVPLPTQKVTDSEFLHKSFVINLLQFQFVFFFLQSLQWILFNCGVTIEPCLKYLCSIIPIPVHDLKIKITL